MIRSGKCHTGKIALLVAADQLHCVRFFYEPVCLDVFEAGVPLGEMLLPMIALAAVLVVAWHWPRVGAALFGLAGLAFSVMFFAEGMRGLGSFLVLGAPC